MEWQNDWCSGEMIGIVVDGVILIDGGMIGSDGDDKMIDGKINGKLMWRNDCGNDNDGDKMIGIMMV